MAGWHKALVFRSNKDLFVTLGHSFNPFLHGQCPLLGILSLGQMGEPYSCTMYTDFLPEVLVSRCFV